MNESVPIPYEEYRKLLIAEVHLSVILEAAAKAKYNQDVREAVDFVRSLREPDAEVKDDAE